VVLISNFVVVEIIGFDPREARQGDLAIGVALFGFYIRTSIWLWYHVVTRVGSSSTQTTIGSFTCFDGLIIRNEKSHKSHENLNNITRLRDIWFPVDPPLLRGCGKFFKPEHNNEFREGNKLVRLEFSRYYCFSELKVM